MHLLQPRYLFSAGLLAIGALISASGCADNNSMMFVRGVIALDYVNCIAKADPSNTYLPYGTLDTAFRDTYTAFLLVGNQLTARSSRNQLRTEPNRVSVRGAVVSLSNGSSFSTTATGFVDPASGDTPGYGLVAVDLIPGVGNVGNPSGEIVATVSVFGDTLGGTSITSNTLTFPIYVCNGCLTSFPSAALDPTVSTSRCVGEQPTDKPCILGQDAPVDCRLCVGNPACVPPASLLGAGP